MPFRSQLPVWRAAVIAGLLTSAGARAAPDGVPKHEAPIPAATLALMRAKDTSPAAPILIRAYKKEAEMEVWKKARSGRFVLLKTFPICRWSGQLGPKRKQGDRQTPEGFYTITPGQMNPNSAYYLSFNIGYPNAYDRAYGRTGAQLMVHGDCSSRGCYSMTDEQISEIYALGRDSFFGGQKSFQVQAYPFRMTAQNLAKHRNSPHLAFWKMLKKGNDHFEVSRLEPKVNVCDKRYVFDAQSPAGRALSFNATAKCPAYEVPEEIASLVRDKEQRDEQQFADLSRRNIPVAPIKTNADGGMHPVFVEAVKKNQLGVAPQESTFLVSTAPGTIPVTVRPPRIPELADAPALAGAAPTPAVSGEVAPPAMAIAETKPAAQPAARSSGSSLFGSLFSSKTAEAKPAEPKSEGTLDRMARLVGLGKKETPAASAAPAPVPKPKPAAKPTSVASNGAIRAKQAEAQPVKTTEAQAPAPGAVTPAVAAPASTAMNGAAAVVPAGTFDNRWSGFR